MDLHGIYQSINTELQSQYDRIRLIQGSNTHFLSDGEYKESLLRSVLKKYLPANLIVGRGFIVGPNNYVSTQVDILIYKDSSPLLFKDSDFVIISPDEVEAVIEVKSQLHLTEKSIRKTFDSLSRIAEQLNYCYKDSHSYYKFVGLFSYESAISNRNWSDRIITITKVLQQLKNKYEGLGMINFVSLGTDYFLRFWDNSNYDIEQSNWSTYKMENLAYAYFIFNVVRHLCPNVTIRNIDSFFPTEGKKSKYLINVFASDSVKRTSYRRN